jgi:Cu(I)/Ag(I) efflux system membrane fusion protein
MENAMMNRTTGCLATAALAAALITGCDGSSPNAETASKQSAPAATPVMPAMQQTAQRVEHMAEGTLSSVDQAAGRVTITHGPVASAGWPGMTMSFKLANPSAAADLKPGQRVEFRFTIESGMDATVTQIKSAD